jgi:hypothetical protein
LGNDDSQEGVPGTTVGERKDTFSWKTGQQIEKQVLICASHARGSS